MAKIGKIMESNKIAIIYTTFLRDELELQTLKSIIDNWQDNYVLLIGDQGIKERDYKSSFFSIQSKLKDKEIHRYILPFDCGLSYARNYLVQKAYKMGIDYCFLTADSIKFTERYDFAPIIRFLEEKEERGIVGFELLNRQYWVYNMTLVPNMYFHLVISKQKPILYNNIKFQSCDVITNFFFAKTKCLIDNKWDNELKLAEHEDFFWRLKQTKYKVFWTNYIKAQYINQKNEEYNKYRKRLYHEFKQKLQQKYNISGWLQYER